MAYRALYRKYRPKLFADIIGQPGITKALANQVETGRLSTPSTAPDKIMIMGFRHCRIKRDERPLWGLEDWRAG